MKKLLVVLAVAILGTMGFVSVSYAVIAGSAHDFSTQPWMAAHNGQICLPCHTPHNADTSVTDGPLWNHQVTTVATYTLYTSSTFEATDSGQPDGRSKLCLSCHDGTVAVDSFGGVTG
ncbi:MAG: cytochrome C, partial [Deltaproteobacteria bacterium]|nr:cytochrome C [Deltaproteobacteria bacterium]